MLTFDGTGCGKSDYWHQVAYRTAKEFGEDCSCWHEKPLEVRFLPDDFKVKINCWEKKSTCTKSFEKTEQAIEKMFKDFYKT